MPASPYSLKQTKEAPKVTIRTFNCYPGYRKKELLNWCVIKSL